MSEERVVINPYEDIEKDRLIKIPLPFRRYKTSGSMHAYPTYLSKDFDSKELHIENYLGVSHKEFLMELIQSIQKVIDKIELDAR